MADIVPLVALVISVGSLTVAAYSAYNARRVYRASLQPIVDVNYSLHYVGGTIDGNVKLPPRATLVLKNTGKGTARFLHPFSASLKNKRWSVTLYTHELDSLEPGPSQTLGLGEPPDETELVIVVTFKDVLNKVFRTMAHFSYDSDNEDWWQDGQSRI